MTKHLSADLLQAFQDGGDGAVGANAVRKRLRDLSHKIGPTLQPVFVSKKLGQDLRPKEIKPSIVNKQCVVYNFSCDLCDADCVGYTARHLHQRIAEHKKLLDVVKWVVSQSIKKHGIFL